ncbi:MAG: HAD-IIA family hydrolase [Anaerolineaceae bacterium]|nr:HAD-IIA family hydrolase [Anaerolineaceae bacterium]
MPYNNHTQLKNIRALLLDLDGTLWRGNAPLPGVETIVDFLKRHNIAFTIATNSAVKPAAVYRERLAAFGIELIPENILTVSQTTAIYLKAHFAPGAAVYVIGEEGLKGEVEAAGFNLRMDSQQNVAAVVVGGDRRLTYDKLKHAAFLLQRGAAFIGTNPDIVYPTEEGLAPECGATLAALQAISGAAPVIIGKPQPHLFQAGMQRMGSHPENTAMIGDRLETDIHGGQQAGLMTILITTGIDDETSIPLKNIQPDLVVHSLAELVAFWQQALAA